MCPSKNSIKQRLPGSDHRKTHKFIKIIEFYLKVTNLEL